MDKSHGARFDRGLIQKRSSKLALVLAEKEEKGTEITPETKTKPEIESTKEKIRKTDPEVKKTKKVIKRKNKI